MARVRVLFRLSLSLPRRLSSKRTKRAPSRSRCECAKKCIQGGSPAVLVTADGTIYKIANQDKLVSHAGENVTVTGKANGDTITVDSVK